MAWQVVLWVPQRLARDGGLLMMITVMGMGKRIADTEHQHGRIPTTTMVTEDHTTNTTQGTKAMAIKRIRDTITRGLRVTVWGLVGHLPTNCPQILATASPLAVMDKRQPHKHRTGKTDVPPPLHPATT